MVGFWNAVAIAAAVVGAAVVVLWFFGPRD
jgi:hypothetical protein